MTTPTDKAGQVAAFFDLDRTLLTVNSGKLWLRAERRAGRLGLTTLLRASYYLLAYKLGRIDMQKVMLEALATIRGVEEESIREQTRRWYFDEVAQHEAPGAAAVLAWHRKRGHRCVLHTASSLYEAEAAVEHFGLDDFLCTRYEVRDGRFTGGVIQPMCYGPGKVDWAERLAREQDIDLASSYFYSDSITDRFMLQRVGHPHVVQPDPKLAALARERGWPVLDWSRPGVEEAA